MLLQAATTTVDHPHPQTQATTTVIKEQHTEAPGTINRRVREEGTTHKHLSSLLLLLPVRTHLRPWRKFDPVRKLRPGTPTPTLGTMQE
jgi:hypothetical protein